MKTKEFLEKHSACVEGAQGALSISDDMSGVWDALIKEGRHAWLMWTATRPGVFPDSVLRKLACRFIRETPLADGRKVWDLLTDERSRKVVEVAEQYAEGKATKQELNAADGFADGAYADAYDGAAIITAATEAASYVAVDDAAYAVACVAARASYAAACFGTGAADYAADYAAAEAAQIQMIAELGDPFKERVKQ